MASYEAAHMLRKAAILTFFSFIAVSSVSCFLVSEAAGVVSEVQMSSDVVLDQQGNPDFAVTVYCTVENVGEAGKIMVTPRLSSSEGDWSQAEELYFDAGELRNLKFLFPQPSISVEDLKARVGVYPEPSDAS
jgi:hypothetical protein